MKIVIFGILFFAIFANSAVTQNSIIGNWGLPKQKPTDPNAMLFLEKDSLILTKDWHFTEFSVYGINYPSYGAKKVNLKYKLKVKIEGDYRIENDALRKYFKVFESEVLEETASDIEAAQSSLKEIEKMIKDDIRFPAPFLNVSETEMNLQGVNGNPDQKYAKPKKLPISQLTRDTVPFFAPEGWRYPESAKELAEFAIRLKNDKNLFTVVKGDFNGDGLIDAAAYLINPEREQVALFVNMSKEDESYDLNPYGSADKNTIIENGIMLAPAGEYVNSVSKEKITIENPGFIVIIFDTAANLIYWDSRSKDWISIPIGKKF